MKKLLVMMFPLVMLTGCQAAQPMSAPTELGETEPLASSQVDLIPVAAPVLPEEQVLINHESPVTNTGATPMLNNDSGAHEMLLGVDLNACQHRLTSLGFYDKKSFARYQLQLDKHISLINKYLSVRNTLSEPAASYFDEKYKTSLDMTCSKIQHQVDAAVNRSVQAF